MISMRLFGCLSVIFSLFRAIVGFSSASWVDLTENGAVQKHTIADGTGAAPKKGDTIEINYVGSLMDHVWDASDVVQCWLLSQQGLDDLADTFLEQEIDGNKLADDSFLRKNSSQILWVCLTKSSARSWSWQPRDGKRASKSFRLARSLIRAKNAEKVIPLCCVKAK